MDDPRPGLQAALKAAMKAKDVSRRDAIRLVLNTIKQAQIDSQDELSAEDIMSILQREAKKCRESIDEFEQAGRDDLVEQERAVLTVIEAFLPQQLSKTEIAEIVQGVIEETGATSMKDMGNVMKSVMVQVKGVADGKLVNQIVREQLST